MDMVCASFAFIDGLGAPEMVLIFVVVLVLFGGQKLPEFARGLGKSIREFKKAAAGVEEEFKRALEEDERKHATPQLAAPAAEPVDNPDVYGDSAGPEADVHSPVTHDEIATETEPYADDTPDMESSSRPETEEPKILPPTPPPDEAPKPSAPPAAGPSPANAP
jgi:sec-independent protein translocase protein TatA